MNDRTASTDGVGTLSLLTDPFLQLPTVDGVHVVWFTEYAGERHAVFVGPRVAELDDVMLATAPAGALPSGVTVFSARTTKLSRVAEDAGSHLPADRRPTEKDGIVARDVWRHEAAVTGLSAGSSVPYRVVSRDGDALGGSGTFRLQPLPSLGQPLRVLLTSDHQAMANTPANLEMALATIGAIDAVFLAGDLVNVPDRGSEWFDDARGSAFFPVLQGKGGRAGTNDVEYHGGQIIQNAPLFPAIGNHEVQGRRDGMTSLSEAFHAPVPRAIAEAAYATVAAEVNIDNDAELRQQWIENNSFSTRTYEELFTLPDDSPGGETYYALTFGDIRLISLYSTRIWRSTVADPNPAARVQNSRYQEAATNLEDPLRQGHGEFIFEPVGADSEQFAWLEAELRSSAFTEARYRIVILHEGPQGLGENVMPVFADPTRIDEVDAAGNLIGARYEYEMRDNRLLHDLQPLLENAGVHLVHSGHSHLWCRFVSDNGVTHFLETSNTGNSYGAYHPVSGRRRPVPPAPWAAANYLAIGNPGGLTPVTPTEHPHVTSDGTPMPFVQSNDHVVFTVFDTGTGDITSWSYDLRTPDDPPVILDRFSVGSQARAHSVVQPTAPAVGPHHQGTEEHRTMSQSTKHAVTT